VFPFPKNLLENDWWNLRNLYVKGYVKEGEIKYGNFHFLTIFSAVHLFSFFINFRLYRKKQNSTKNIFIYFEANMGNWLIPEISKRLII